MPHPSRPTLTLEPKIKLTIQPHMQLTAPPSRLPFAHYALPRAVCARLTCHHKEHRHPAAAEKVLRCISLLSAALPLMLSHVLVLLFELLVKIISLQLVSWAACHLSREYMKAVLEVAHECLAVAESFYATRAIVPGRV